MEQVGADARDMLQGDGEGSGGSMSVERDQGEATQCVNTSIEEGVFRAVATEGELGSAILPQLAPGV